MMSPTSFRARLCAALLLPLALVACSLPTDERVSPYNPADLPGNLTNTTTTTTTTTTTSTTVPPVTESLPGGQTTTTSSTTTIAPPLTSPVVIFYTIGFTDEVQAIRRELIAPVPIRLVLEQLESPLFDIGPYGLRSSVRSGLILGDVLLERAVATVVLDPLVLGRLSNDEQRRAIAQIVLTLTSFVTAEEGAIGFVRFEVDGDGFSVFVPSLGGNSDPGEALAFVDFASWVVETSLSSPTTTTTNPPSTPITTPITTTNTSTTTTSTTTTAPAGSTIPGG